MTVAADRISRQRRRAEKSKRLRASLRLTQWQLAAVLDVNVIYVSRYERGGALPADARAKIDEWVIGEGEA